MFKTKIAVISVPFIISETHFNLAKSTLISLISNKHDYELNFISVINRFDSSEEDMNWLKNISSEFIFNDKNILARAWNIGIKKALQMGAELILVTNLDIFFHEHFLQNLITFAKENPSPIIWGGINWPPPNITAQDDPVPLVFHGVHFSCFLCDHRLFSEVGEFDEAFMPAYHEDSDMTYRISLSGHSALSTSSARYNHLDRGTLKAAIEAGNPEFVVSTQQYLDSSLQYYCKKWGGPPGKETYTKSFGK